MIQTRKSSFKKNIMTICFLAFFADMIGAVMSPTQTLFAIDIGASMTFIGMMAAASSIVSIIVAIPIGIISDRRGRKPLILIGFVLRFFATVLYGIAFHPYQLLIATIIQSVGASASYVNFRAYIADTTEPSRLGQAVGFFSTAMGIGVTLGSLLGGFASALWGYQQSYFIASSFALMGAVLAMYGVKTIEPAESGSARAKIPSLSALYSIIRQPEIFWLSLMNIIDFTIMGLVMIYFPVYGKGLGYSSETIGFLFFIRGLATTVIRIPVGLAISRVREPVLIISTLAIGIAGLVAFSFTDNYYTIIMLMIIQGVSFGGFLTASSTFLLKAAPQLERGTKLGLVSIFQGIVNTLLSYQIGVTVEVLGVNITYLLMGLAMGFIFLISVSQGYVKKIYRLS